MPNVSLVPTDSMRPPIWWLCSGSPIDLNDSLCGDSGLSWVASIMGCQRSLSNYLAAEAAACGWLAAFRLEAI